MNRTELFNEVKNWLEAGKISFVANDEFMFRFRINADNGLFDLCLLCEEEPATLRVCCPIQVRIPEQKVGETSLLLHNLNTRLRIGAFQFHVEDSRRRQHERPASACAPDVRINVRAERANFTPHNVRAW